MKSLKLLFQSVSLSYFLVLASTIHAEIPLDDEGKVSLYGDFRARFETDWDSAKADGTKRDDRSRSRVRFRLGTNIKPTDYFSIGARLRTGSDDSQQSPHITVLDFDNNSTGDSDFNFDKWFGQLSDSKVKLWVGRNSLPFWKQNELFWDDDVTPAGAGFNYNYDLKDGSIGINAGYFSLPAGMQNFSGNMGLGQLVFSHMLGNSKLTAAGGWWGIDGDSNDPDNVLLLDSNSSRDYSILIGSLQFTVPIINRPFKLGLDYAHNSENYSVADPDTFTSFHRNEKDAYVASILYGNSKELWETQFGFFWSYIETLALNSSYTQDDWIRWGSATQTQSTNFEGQEIRIVIGLGGNMNLVARLYLVDAIKPRSSEAIQKEDGKRFRLDFNYKF